MSTELPPKQIVCRCGHSFSSQQHSNWCTKCGRQVFYHERDQKKSRLNHIYITVLIVLVAFLLSYFFIELILTPILTHFQ